MPLRHRRQHDDKYRAGTIVEMMRSARVCDLEHQAESSTEGM